MRRVDDSEDEKGERRREFGRRDEIWESRQEKMDLNFGGAPEL